MGYTREEIIKKCEEEFKNIATFYQADVINYRGKTSDTKELFNEIVAEFVIKNLKAFQTTIPQITRKTSYKTEGHDGDFSPTSNREEEQIAMKMFKQSKAQGTYEFIGKIIDYQTPLKNSKNDVAGKIDLLAYDGNTIRVLELKKPDSKETMLRCVLEGFTYMKTANWAKLLEDFQLNPTIEIKASPFVFYPSAQKDDMEEERPNLHKLMELLDSKPYYIIQDNNTYKVEG